jgi:hypothetical protein
MVFQCRLPNIETRGLSPDGRIGDLVEIDTDVGIVRRVQASIVIDITTAEQLIKLLQEQVEVARK